MTAFGWAYLNYHEIETKNIGNIVFWTNLIKQFYPLGILNDDDDDSSGFVVWKFIFAPDKINRVHSLEWIRIFNKWCWKSCEFFEYFKNEKNAKIELLNF